MYRYWRNALSGECLGEEAEDTVVCKKQVELGGQQKPSLHGDNMLWNKEVRRWGQRSNGREEVKKEKGKIGISFASWQYVHCRMRRRAEGQEGGREGAGGRVKQRKWERACKEVGQREFLQVLWWRGGVAQRKHSTGNQQDLVLNFIVWMVFCLFSLYVWSSPNLIL